MSWASTPAWDFTQVAANQSASAANTAQFDTGSTATIVVGDGTNPFTANGTPTFSYSKAGNIVMARVRYLWSSKGSASGTIQLTGAFPDYSAVTNIQPISQVIEHTGITIPAGSHLVMDISGAADTFRFASKVDETLSTGLLSDSAFAASGTLEFLFTYTTV